MAQTLDMTRGAPARLIISFALPLMLGTIFQQLYSLVDSAVVGQLLGVDAFAAVGAASFFGWLAFSVVLGMTQGFGVLFAQRFGAKVGLKRAVAMAVLLAFALSAAMTALFLLCVRPVLVLVRTPEALLPGALAYLHWTLGGLIVTFFYNTAAPCCARWATGARRSSPSSSPACSTSRWTCSSWRPFIWASAASPARH